MDRGVKELRGRMDMAEEKEEVEEEERRQAK